MANDHETRTVLLDEPSSTRVGPFVILETLRSIVGPSNIDVGDDIPEAVGHDESIGGVATRPLAVVRPSTTEEVAAIVRAAQEFGVPLTPRGSGTGLSGASIPSTDGVVVSFERMNQILEIDLENHVVVVQPGVTLFELEDALRETELIYPVFPGEQSASLGGNIATNAGGMRAVKYGVTRHHVLGLEAVLGTGEVISTGGKFVKATSGYDLTQLFVGSEGTLALITEATLRLHPRAIHHGTLLAPFTTLHEVARAVPRLVGSGCGPLIVEYIDFFTMSAITERAGIDLAIPDVIREQALAYLVVVLENHRSDRVDEDLEEVGVLLADLGALDVYVLPGKAGAELIHAREGAFWVSKAAGADDLVDVVIPRACMPEYLEAVSELASATSSLILGCGHAGDGNVHLSVFQPDPTIRHEVLRSMFKIGVELGGAISGEHGIGRAKREYLAEFEDPTKLRLMASIKGVFDPQAILNPGAIFALDDLQEVQV